MQSVPSELGPILAWFKTRGWEPLPFQMETWKADLAGESGLIQVPTGSGKTYAAIMGPIARMLAQPGQGLQLLYITPLLNSWLRPWISKNRQSHPAEIYGHPHLGRGEPGDF